MSLLKLYSVINYTYTRMCAYMYITTKKVMYHFGYVLGISHSVIFTLVSIEISYFLCS